MCNKIIGLIIGLVLGLGVSVYAYRAPKPAKITKFDESAVTQLNTDLENLWNLSNGRYINDIIISVPTKKSEEGATQIYSSGGIYRIYIYLNGGWRVWTSD